MSDLVGNPEDRFSRVTAHLTFITLHVNVRFPCRGIDSVLYDLLREKTNNLGFRPGLTQTGLYSHRSRVEA